MDQVFNSLPIQLVFDPSQRLYWPFLLSAGLVAYIYTIFSLRTYSLSTTFYNIKKTLLSPSSLLDIKLMFLNSGLKLFIFPFIALSSFSVSLVVLKTLRSLWPFFQGVEASPIVISILAAAMAFIIDDFLRFFQHVLSHYWEPMNRLHRTHHSADVLTPLTFFRSHPLESFLSGLRNTLSLGLTLGLYSFIFGGVVSGLDILGVNALGFLFNATFSNLRHSSIPLGFGPLERILISPRMHQIHHSNNPIHFNKNFGVALAIWDQLLGSYYRPSAQEMGQVSYGLERTRHESRSLSAALLAPFTKLKVFPIFKSSRMS